MIDNQKQIAYWQNGAIEDWDVAAHLINRGKYRHGLFFAHLAIEKLLKAHVCRFSNDLAPRLHNLSRLAELTGLPLSQTQADILADMNAFNLEGRSTRTWCCRHLRRRKPRLIWIEPERYLHGCSSNCKFCQNIS
jgi:HEPN domain-containing protein